MVGVLHEEQLSLLLDRVGAVMDRFRAGELDAFDADAELFQYGRAAKELWKFCNDSDTVAVAAAIAGGLPMDWWARGAFRRR